MPRQVRDMMTSRNKLIILEPDDPLRLAFESIRQYDIHGVMVKPAQGRANWQIFTASDLVRVKAARLDPDQTKMSEVSNDVIYSASANWTEDQCWDHMYRNNVEHLPVIDEQTGELLGIITLTDLQKYL